MKELCGARSNLFVVLGEKDELQAEIILLLSEPVYTEDGLRKNLPPERGIEACRFAANAENLSLMAERLANLAKQMKEAQHDTPDTH